jgi:hypothetical protein
MEFSRFSLHFCLCFLLACLGPIAVSSFLGPSVRQETFLGRRSFLLKTSNIADISSLEGRHVVNDIICREIPMDLPTVGRITILEATAESQEELVDMALLLEEEVVQQQNQKLREGDPYGAVLWPAAWAVANYLLTNSTIDLSSCTLLELGTGTGLVSMAAALGGGNGNSYRLRLRNIGLGTDRLRRPNLSQFGNFMSNLGHVRLRNTLATG